MRQVVWFVSPDGRGDFPGVQAAIDAVPHGARLRTVIRIGAGVYREKVSIPRGKKISLIGETAQSTVLVYSDYARKTRDNGEAYGTFRTPTLSVEADDCYLENLTVANDAGFGPDIGQALAAAVLGDGCAFYRVWLLGNQDTVYLQGPARHYFRECRIEGHVDYVFGSAQARFENCRIHSLRRGYITAASTPADQPEGFAFMNCRITGEDEEIVYLGRPWRPYSCVAFYRCWMDRSVHPEGWDNWRNSDNERTARYSE